MPNFGIMTISYFIISLILIIIHQSHSNLLKIGDKQLILDIHNWIRAQVAMGANGLSSVSNMRAMDWNQDLEHRSLQFRSKCDVTSKPQNLVKMNDSHPVLSFKFKSLDNVKNISRIVKTIFIKLNVINNHKCKGNPKCKKTNQILEPHVSSVGCSLIQCRPLNLILTCVYNLKPLKTSFSNSDNPGRPCSNCSHAFSYCINETLCATELQCARAYKRQCRCLIKKDVCLMNGKFLEDKCQCFCNSGFAGISCQEKCTDKMEICGKSVEKCLQNSTEGLLFRNHCPKTCGLCFVGFPVSDSNPSNLSVRVNSESYKLEMKFTGVNQCFDKLWQCSIWSQENLCFLKTVQIVCPKSCRGCQSDYSISHDQNRNCTDKKKECQRWAKNFCYIKIVQQICPLSCETCSEALRPEKFSCEEKYSLLSTCENVMKRNLCHLPSMQAICPVTCGNPKCTNPLPTTTQRNQCVEPDSVRKPCHDFKIINYCTISEIREFCPITCAISKCKQHMITSESSQFTSLKSSTSLTVEPIYCRDMRGLCENPTVKAICKQTCDTSNSLIYSVISTSSTTSELSQSPKFEMPSSTQISSRSSKLRSSSSRGTSSLTSKTTTQEGSSSSVKRLTAQPSICIGMEHSCTNPVVRTLCIITCGTISNSSPSTPRLPSSISSFVSSTSDSKIPLSKNESIICPHMKKKCHEARIKEICPLTCMTTTSSIPTKQTQPSKTDPMMCNDLKKYCSDPNVKMICKSTCRTTTTAISSKSSKLSTSDSTTRISTDPTVCIILKVSCDEPDIKALCKRTCSTTTTPISSTSSTLPNSLISRTSDSTTLISTDPTVCILLKVSCDEPDIKALCKRTCDLSSKKKCQSTELIQCVNMKMLCNNPGVKELCPVTCDECASSILPHTKESITTETTTEFSYCQKVKNQCGNPEIASLCPITCLG